MIYQTSLPSDFLQEDDTLASFLEISRNLLDMIRIESAIFEKDGKFTIEDFWKHKANLLTSFEKKAEQIINALNEDTAMCPRKFLLLEEIKTIQYALQTNTQHHFKSLSAHVTIKNTADEVSSWH